MFQKKIDRFPFSLSSPTSFSDFPLRLLNLQPLGPLTAPAVT